MLMVKKPAITATPIIVAAIPVFVCLLQEK